jgi:hypothetical protein
MMRNSPKFLIDISGGARETPPDWMVPSAGCGVSIGDAFGRGSSAGGGDGMQIHPRHLGVMIRTGGTLVVPRGAEQSQVVRRWTLLQTIMYHHLLTR